MTELPPPPQPTVDAIYAARRAREDERPSYMGYGIPASLLGSPCDRQLFLTLRWASAPEVVDGRRLRIFDRGNAAETRIIEDLRAAGLEVLDSDPDTGRQFKLELANGWLRGKADGVARGVLEAPKAMHVIEIKCLKAADWRAIQKHGLAAKKPEHWHQLHTGMAALGISRGLYIAENADTMELLTERLHLDIEESNRQIARVHALTEMHEAPLGMLGSCSTDLQREKQSNTPPCRFCSHRPLCFENAMPLRNCRTCLHFSFERGPDGHCARFDQPLRPFEQQAGKDCPAHLYLPTLIPGEQVDADPERELITYQMRDGSYWTDGAEKETTA